MQGEIKMTYREIDRVSIIRQVIEGKISQKEAAKTLKLSTRQLRRLERRYEQYGPIGVVNKHRGRPSNNRLPQELIEQAISHIECHFYDYVRH